MSVYTSSLAASQILIKHKMQPIFQYALLPFGNQFTGLTELPPFEIWKKKKCHFIIFLIFSKYGSKFHKFSLDNYIWLKCHEKISGKKLQNYLFFLSFAYFRQSILKNKWQIQQTSNGYISNFSQKKRVWHFRKCISQNNKLTTSKCCLLKFLSHM